MTSYPLDEETRFRYICPGCQKGKVATVPKHGAPYVSRCRDEGCGWVMTIQTDIAGISVGHQAPIPQKPELRLVKPLS